MANNALHKVVEQAKANRRRNRWNKVVTGMAALVVFCTTYAMILPAITEEREPLCGLEEHLHEDKCWELPKVITCPYEAQAENGQLPLMVHTHDEFCYDTLGNLICALPEVESHVHDYGCYTEIVPEAPHTHEDACYTEETVLTCTVPESEDHVHGDGCVFGEPQLICEIPEAHVHGDGCKDESGNLVCQIPENHTHGDSCYAEPVCELPESEGHTHGDGCYTLQKVLICEKTEATPEELAAYTGEPEQILICGKEEVILHQHTEDCRDEEFNLICGLTELFAHQHGKECLTATKDPEAEKVLVCGFKEEHTHDDTCYTDLEADLETPEIWEAGLPEHTDNWADDLLAVAEPQLGYAESTENVTVSPEGQIFGITRYGQWAGTPYAPWSLLFVDFCQHYAGIPADAYPVHEGQLRWCEKLKEENWNLYRSPDQYTPVPGDLVFLDMDVDGKMDAEAIVLALTEASDETEAKLTVIQGDVENAVQKAEYDPADPVILGYASTAAARSRWDLLNPAPEPEPVRYCGLEAHTHAPACYDEEENLICELEEHVHDESCEQIPPSYRCGLVEHEHDEYCRDNEGNLTCDLEEHSHTDECIVYYICGKEEHTHVPECSDENGEVICGREEHTHESGCRAYWQTLIGQKVDSAAKLLRMARAEVNSAEVVISAGAILPEGTYSLTYEAMDPDKATDWPTGGDFGTPVLGFKDVQIKNGEVPLEITQENPVQITISGLTLEANVDYTIYWWSAVSAFAENEEISTTYNKATVTFNQEQGIATFSIPENNVNIALMSGSYQNPNPPCPGDGCDLDEYLTQWTPCTGTNPFGTAQEYNLFLLGDMRNWKVVHGNAAIMGSIYENNGGIGYDDGSNQNYSGDKTSHFYLGLVLGGVNNATKEVTVKNGTVISQEPQGEPISDSPNDRIDMDALLDTDHNHIATADELKFFFDNAKGDTNVAGSLLNRNQETFDYCEGNKAEKPGDHEGRVDYLSVYDMTTDAYGDGGHNITAGAAIDSPEIGNDKTKSDVILEGTNDLYNVFNIPEDMLSEKTGGQPRNIFLVVPYGSYTIINVEDTNNDGKVEDFLPLLNYQDSDKAWISQPAKHDMANYTQTQRTLINFDPNIEKVTIGAAKGSYVYASILGPKVELEVPENCEINLQGTIVLKELHDIGGNSAILENPFSVGSKLKLSKDVVCDDNEENCPTNGEKTDKTHWAGYFADVTLESVHDTSSTEGTSETIVIHLPSLELSRAALTIDGLAPGKYVVSAEQVYRDITVAEEDYRLYIEPTTGKYYTGEGDNKQFYTYDEQNETLTAATREDAVPDEEFINHRFNQATFGIGSADEGKVVLEVSMGMVNDILITNHYGVGQTQKHVVQKTWWERGTYIDQNGREQEIVYEITPPDGAYVKIALYRKRSDTEDSPENWEKVPAGQAGKGFDGEPLEPEVRVDAAHNWTFAWTGLPDLVEGETDVRWEYKADETYCYEGFVESENSPHNVGGIETFYNYRKEAKPGNLEVTKFWYDEKGNILNGANAPAGSEDRYPNYLNVALYCRDGSIDEKEEGVDYPTVTIKDSSGAILKTEKVFSGSAVAIHINFEVNTGDANLKPTGYPCITLTKDGAKENLKFSPESAFSHNRGFFQKVLATLEIPSVMESCEYVINIPYTSDSPDDNNMYIVDRAFASTYPDLHAPDPRIVEHPSKNHFTWSGFKPVTDTYPQLLTTDSPIAEKNVILSKGNDWSHIWQDLPKVDANGNQLQYFVFEDIPADYEQSYKVAGTDYPNATPEAPNGVPGMTEGYITIENRPIIGGPELPMTGGPGTALYTLGGLLTAVFAGFLLQYNHRKRGKEGNAF